MRDKNIGKEKSSEEYYDKKSRKGSHSKPSDNLPASRKKKEYSKGKK